MIRYSFHIDEQDIKLFDQAAKVLRVSRSRFMRAAVVTMGRVITKKKGCKIVSTEEAGTRTVDLITF